MRRIDYSMEVNPKISVIMPVYNGEKYLREAIDSILKQTFTDFEFIILNDGSIDKTEEIILSYDDHRIVYVKNESNLKVEETLNKGIQLAKGEYIARMDADDISLPERFEKQLKVMEKNPNIDICGSWMQRFNDHGDINIRHNVETHDEIKVHMLFYTAFAHNVLLIKKEFFEHYRYIKQYDRAEDYDLWIRSIDQCSFYNIQEVLVKYRMHNAQVTQRSEDDINPAWIEVNKGYLDRIGYSLNDKERECFYSLNRPQLNTYRKSEKLIKKILMHNEKSGYFDQDILKRELGKKYWYVINCNAHHGIKLFISYMSSPLRKYIKISKLEYFKYFLKCVLGYSSCK